MKTPNLFEAEPTLSNEEQIGCDRRALFGHDARSALSDILGGLSLIPDVSLDPRVRRQLDRVRCASEHLAELWEHGFETSPPVPVTDAGQRLNLQDFLDTLARRFRGATEAAGLGFDIVLAPDLPAALMIDKLSLARILGNLISNAISYAGTGTITLSLRRQEPDRLVMTLRDEGPGFSIKNPQELFEPGKRGAQGKLREGDGLGLFIARKLAHRLGGELSAANALTGGAEMVLDLPLEPAPPSRQAPPVQRPQLPDLSERRVLIADDSLTTQAMLGDMLGALGAQVSTQSDGRGAGAALLACPFDLAILDIDLPGNSGLEIIAKLRGSALDWADMPIVVCTGHAQKEMHMALHHAGADAVLVKPFSGVLALGQSILDAIALRASYWERDEIPAPDGMLDSFLEQLPAPESTSEKSRLAQFIIADLQAIRQALNAACHRLDYDAIKRQCHRLCTVADIVGEASLALQSRTLQSLIEHGSYIDIQDLIRHALEGIGTLIHQLTHQFAIQEN